MLESKTRTLKNEKLTATLNMNKAKKNAAKQQQQQQQPPQPPPTSTSAAASPHQSESSSNDHPTTPSTTQDDTEKDKHAKSLQQIEKKLVQIDKKRAVLKRTYDKCLNKLRSGVHLGQDRFMRHYWSLVNAGGIYVEACQQARPGTYYFSDNSHILAKRDDTKDEAKTEDERERDSTR